MNSEDFQKLVKAATDRFDALTPEQQLEHRRQQRKSWVIGEMMLEHPEMSREAAERIYEKVKF